MLNVKNLSIRYGEQCLFSGLSFRLLRGQMLCVCGESGCGKSSLLKAVLGLVAAEGDIEVGGIRLCEQHVAAVRRHIAYVPQELALPAESVREMVQMPFALRANRSTPFNEARLMAHWRELGLDTGLMEKRVGEISGGQRQRIMLAVAGVLGKPLLLADEPTSALDEESAQRVYRYFQRLAAEQDMAILVVSHAPVFLQSPKVLNLSSSISL